MKEVKKKLIKKNIAGRNKIYSRAKKMMNQFQLIRNLKEQIVMSLKNLNLNKGQLTNELNDKIK